MATSCGCGPEVCEICDTKDVVKTDEAVNTPAERVESRRTYLPAVDVLDGEKETLLVADMPGVRAGDVEVTVENDVLTIKGKPAEDSFGGKKLAYSEYGVGDYERSFTLGEGASKDGITAEIKDGVLRIRIPKPEPVSKRVTVSVG